VQVGGRETYVPPGSGWENADPNRPADLGPKTTIFDDQKDTDLSARGRGFRSRRRSKDHPNYMDRGRAREEPPDRDDGSRSVSSRMNRSIPSLYRGRESQQEARALDDRGLGPGLSRARARVLVFGRMERPLELVLRRQSPESWMRLRSIAPAREFCARQDEET